MPTALSKWLTVALVVSGLYARAQCCEKVYALEDSTLLNLTQMYIQDIAGERYTGLNKGIYELTVTDHGEGGKSYSYKYIYEDRFKKNLPDKWSYIGSDILLIYDGSAGCEERNERNIETMYFHIGDRVFINPPKTQKYGEYRLGPDTPYRIEEFDSQVVGNDSHNIIYLVDKRGKLVRKIRPA